MRQHAIRLSAISMIAAPAFAIAAADVSAPPVDYVSHAVPVTANAMQHRAGAFRPLQMDRAATAISKRSANAEAFGSWNLLATLSGVSVIHDISFVSTQVGYAAGERGLVLKTIDGGKTWTSAMSSNTDSYYWYGIQALTEQDLLVSGFYDGPPIDSSPSEFAVVRWSHDGGTTWSDDIVLPTDTAFRAHFFDASKGIVLAAESPNYIVPAFLTQDGGATSADWAIVTADPNEDWFGSQFSALATGSTRASGISYCASANYGTDWNCGPSVDAVFDGATFFLDETHGWVGGGSISPTVEGWLHRTTDGGQSWSDRTLDSAWPIREIRFATASLGWAAGGNSYSGVGGIFRSDDGGQSWQTDVDTGAEMDACAVVSYMAYCVGYDGSFTGYVYGVDWDHIFVDGMESSGGQ